MKPVKLIVSCKKTLEFKYGKKFTSVKQLLSKLRASDKKKGLDSRIVFIDDPASAKAAGIKAVKNISAKECKDAIDALYKKYIPAYIVIVGAQDIFPFQEIKNPALAAPGSKMPAWGGVIADEDHAPLAAYVRSLGGASR